MTMMNDSSPVMLENWEKVAENGRMVGPQNSRVYFILRALSSLRRSQTSHSQGQCQ